MSTVQAAATIDAVLAQRAQILARADAIGRLDPAAAPEAARGAAFGAVLDRALVGPAATSRASGAASAAFERGDSDDIAGVMLKRQTASIDFQATLQIRNRLLSAYRDIMNMPV